VHFAYVASLAYLDQYNPALQLEVSPPGSLLSCSPFAAAGSGHMNAQIAALLSTPPAQWPKLESQLDRPSSTAGICGCQVPTVLRNVAGCRARVVHRSPGVFHTFAHTSTSSSNIWECQGTGTPPARQGNLHRQVQRWLVLLCSWLKHWTWFPESQMPPCTVDTYIVPHVQGFGQQLISKCCTGTGPPPGSASTGVAGAGPEVASAGVVRAGAPSLPPACSKTG
jgi:hypothetical protein